MAEFLKTKEFPSNRSGLETQEIEPLEPVIPVFPSNRSGLETTWFTTFQMCSNTFPSNRSGLETLTALWSYAGGNRSPPTVVD